MKKQVVILCAVWAAAVFLRLPWAADAAGKTGTSAARAPTPVPVRIVSYDRNFIVVSLDPAWASWTAHQAEQIRTNILKELGWKQTWKSPLLLRVVVDPRGKKTDPKWLVFENQADAREKIRRAILRAVFNGPPYWLQCGLERYFSGRKDFHPDALRQVRSSRPWLELKTLLRVQHAFADAQWQDVFEREAACLVLFFKKKHPQVLLDWCRRKGRAQAVENLNKEWAQWVVRAPRLMPLDSTAQKNAAELSTALRELLSVRVVDAAGAVLTGRSLVEAGGLNPCCRKFLARKKLLENYDALVQIDKLDVLKATTAGGYIECANRILEGKDFYEDFERLEKKRLAGR